MLTLSAITPSFNQAPFLRQALDSIHSQGCAGMEHWVMDGGSTDGSVAILEEYAAKGLLRFTSEKDRGQSHAINKGLRLLTGDIVCWLNSDDAYAPGTLPFVARFFEEHPEVHVLTGDCRFTDPEDAVLSVASGSPATLEGLIRVEQEVWQPATFFRRSLLDTAGYLDERLQYAMDYELWTRFARVAPFHYVRRVLADYRIHPEAKTARHVQTTFLPEVCRVSRGYWGSPLSRAYWERRAAVARYAGGIYYGAAIAAREKGDRQSWRHCLLRAIRYRPERVLYWRELRWLLSRPPGPEGTRTV